MSLYSCHVKPFPLWYLCLETTQENVNTIKHSIQAQNVDFGGSPASILKWVSLNEREEEEVRPALMYDPLMSWPIGCWRTWGIWSTRTRTHTHTPLVSGERSIACALSESAKVWVPNTAADRSDAAEVWLQTLGARKGISWRSRRSKTLTGHSLNWWSSVITVGKMTESHLDLVAEVHQ